MADQPDDRIARWRGTRRVAAISCFIGATVVAVLAYKHALPGHSLSQIAPFLVHLGLCGVMIVMFARWRRHIVVPVFFFAIFGIITVINALAQLTWQNAAALLLLLPSIVLLELLDGSGGADVKPPRATLRAAVYGFLYLTVYYVLIVATVVAVFVWFDVVTDVIMKGVDVDLLHKVVVTVRYFAEHWWLAAFALAGSALVALITVLASLAYERALHIGPLTDEQNDLVQTRLQQLFDYVNAPEQEVSKAFPSFMTQFMAASALFFAVTFGLMEALDLAANRLFPAASVLDERQLVIRDTAPIALALILLIATIWSLCRFWVDRTPNAFKKALVEELQDADKNQQRWLIRDLARTVRDTTGTFDPGAFLRSRRRRKSRHVYSAGLAAFVLAGLVIWRVLASHTLATENGIEQVSFFTGHVRHSYADVERVLPECRWQNRGDTKLRYWVFFRDSQYVGLLYNKDIPQMIGPLRHVDSHLRQTGARFVLEDAANLRKCVRDVSERYGHRDAFAQIMHVE